jgi:hypothetical protein
MRERQMQNTCNSFMMLRWCQDICTYIYNCLMMLRCDAAVSRASDVFIVISYFIYTIITIIILYIEPKFDNLGSKMVLILLLLLPIRFQIGTYKSIPIWLQIGTA